MTRQAQDALRVAEQGPAQGPGQAPGRSVTQTGYEAFQAALLDGRLRPGQFASQRELGAMLSLSNGALREILPRLQAECLVTVQPRRGILIPAIDLQMVRDAFQMRAALEREAVLQAAAHMPEPRLQEQKRRHLEVLAALETGPRPDVLERRQAVDLGLHGLLIEATGNALLRQAYDINSLRIRLIRPERIRLSRAILPDAFADHLAVLDAILARDAHAAVDAMDRHITNARGPGDGVVASGPRGLARVSRSRPG